MLLHKSLPSLPPNALAPEPTAASTFSPDNESPPSDGYSDTPTELPRMSHKRPSTSRSNSHSGTTTEQARAPPKRPPNSRSGSSRSAHREKVASAPEEERRGNGWSQSTLWIKQRNLLAAENRTLPSTKYNNRNSAVSHKSDTSVNGEDFLIQLALDPNVAPGPSPMINNDHFNSPSAEKENIKPQAPPLKSGSRDYFTVKGTTKPQKASQDYQTEHAPSHPDSPRDSGHSSQPSSPHIAYQEIGREMSSDAIETAKKRKESVNGNSIAAVANDRPRTGSPHAARSKSVNEDSCNGKFKLQEVPKSKKSGGSTRNSQSDPPSTLETMGNTVSNSGPPATSAQLREQQVTIPSLPSTDSPSSLRPDPSTNSSPRTGQDSRTADNGITDSSTTHSSPASTQIQNLPQRGDSLLKSKHPSSRKENIPTASATKLLTSLINAENEDKPLSAPPAIGAQYGNTPTAANGTRKISKQIDSPESGSLVDVSHPPLRARDRVAMEEASPNGSFVAPKQSPYPPAGNQHKPHNGSISTLKSISTNAGDDPASPQKLPRYSAGQEFTMDEDMARILGNEEHPGHESFLRRVSNSVRHARSYSDRGTRLSKEQKWPPRSPLTTSSGFGPEISSSTLSSPETREELIFLKNELRRERQRSEAREERLSELEAALEAKSSIKQMNTELREKRSTMVVLDTQKEIVVRELEILTEHIAESKKSREPLDLNKMSNGVLREFAESLQDLKESFTPQIEDLTQKRNELIEEVTNLTQLKDQNVQEFKQLALKNAELAEFNNTLVHNVQELYKANASPSLEVIRPPPNGLGIYNHAQKDSSTTSFDNRDMRPSIAESNTTSATLVHEQDAEPAAYVTAPQVVNIRKGQPKKFNWKKGGQNVAKGVTKGLKGAFSSSDGAKPPREGQQYIEGIPYNQMVQSQNYPTTEPPRNHHHDPSRQGFGFFNQKGKPQLKTTPNGSVPAVNQTAGVPLFGSELQHRADHEASDVPSIVMRCIQEVEVRGMEVEGIYRKSGGNSQVQQIKEGFERTNDYDLSDPDLDINAVTSTLKQYFRNLPTPLITYDVYDKLLNSAPPIPQTQHMGGGPPQTNPNHNLDPEQREYRVQLMRQAIAGLPPIHRTCLEVLIFHLAKVVDHEKLNLMTSLNVAVVFAPTVMRPESLAREMSESQAKNQAVQFLIENCHGVFLGGKEERGE
ncbi:MAG: hypothetical protein Q9201_004970 [Fulgogasparrea decipioides]